MMLLLVLVVVLMMTTTCWTDDLDELLDYILDVHSLPLTMRMCLQW